MNTTFEPEAMPLDAHLAAIVLLLSAAALHAHPGRTPAGDARTFPAEWPARQHSCGTPAHRRVRRDTDRTPS